jgi:hypothetical protein
VSVIFVCTLTLRRAFLTAYADFLKSLDAAIDNANARGEIWRMPSASTRDQSPYSMTFWRLIEHGLMYRFDHRVALWRRWYRGNGKQIEPQYEDFLDFRPQAMRWWDSYEKLIK